MQDQCRPLSIFFFPAARIGEGHMWQPPADVYRTETGWLIKFDLAGVRPDDIHLVAEESRLTVSGHRRDYTLEECLSYYSLEISYSRFERTISLPCDLQQAQITTDYREGMLLVRVIV